MLQQVENRAMGIKQYVTTDIRQIETWEGSNVLQQVENRDMGIKQYVARQIR